MDVLKDKLAALEVEREKAIGQVNYIMGAIAVLKQLIDEAEKPVENKETSSEAVPAHP